jgi:hypothetical protein
MSPEIIYRTRRTTAATSSRASWGPKRRVLPLNEAPLAGFQYYRAADIWPFLREGETLRLVREAGNPHDANAVAIWFRNEKLGYIPRGANHFLALWMDRGQSFQGRILRLREGVDPWTRVWLRVERTF